jgi:hypothetical protein
MIEDTLEIEVEISWCSNMCVVIGGVAKREGSSKQFHRVEINRGDISYRDRCLPSINTTMQCRVSLMIILPFAPGV